jgi:2,5-diketo-D-gluconate reductase A
MPFQAMIQKDIPHLKFHDGHSIPQFGLGVWQVPNKTIVPVIHEALAAGYRHIDTAAAYDNETGVGEAIRTGTVPREELFVTTKLWNDSQGYDKTMRAFDESLKNLGLVYVYLYLIHWPVPKIDSYLETWRAFIKIHQEGRAKSIGVSNFPIRHLERLIKESGVTPVLNQVELHPVLQQGTLRQYHATHDIVTESWSPLGRGNLFDNPELKGIAKKHNRSVAQIILRWNIDSGFVVIPKSVTTERIRENIAIFEFKLDTEDMARIGKLDNDERYGPDPETFALM